MEDGTETDSGATFFEAELRDRNMKKVVANFFASPFCTADSLVFFRVLEISLVVCARTGSRTRS